MPFNDWLVGQVDRDDDVGMLARFATSGVDDWPTAGRTRQSALRRYLLAKLDCCPETAELLDRALVRARSAWLVERAAA